MRRRPTLSEVLDVLNHWRGRDRARFDESGVAAYAQHAQVFDPEAQILYMATSSSPPNMRSPPPGRLTGLGLQVIKPTRTPAQWDGQVFRLPGRMWLPPPGAT